MDWAHLAPDNMLVYSRDAKAKIQASVSPVQRPGKSWCKSILPDHEWSRTTNNTITPMSHLLIETHLNYEGMEKEIHFILFAEQENWNLSYFKGETV